jgi:hypothetical protein
MRRARPDIGGALMGLRVVLNRLSSVAGFEAEHALVRLAIGQLETLVGQGPKRLSDKLSDKPKAVPGQARLLPSEISSQSANLSDSDDLDSDADAASDARSSLVGQDEERLSDKPKGQAKLIASLAGCWDGVGGVSTSGSMRSRIGEVLPLIAKLAAERCVDPTALFQRTCDRFKADPVVQSKRFGLRVLLSQVEQWVDDVKPPPPSGPSAIVSPARRLLNPAPKESAS